MRILGRTVDEMLVYLNEGWTYRETFKTQEAAFKWFQACGSRNVPLLQSFQRRREPWDAPLRAPLPLVETWEECLVWYFQMVHERSHQAPTT
jgi:hypothetical protein